MSQSLSRVIVHAVYSTKDRIPLISPEMERRLASFVGGILRSENCPPIAIGGASDHLHSLFSLSRTIAIGDLIGSVKGRSSSWLNKGSRMRCKFAWQGGYAVFSVSSSAVETVARYIRSQRVHHMHHGFQEELRILLHSHGIDFDERYLWD